MRKTLITKVMKLVKQSFKPEFINRLDELMIFNPLNLKVQMEIAKKLLNGTIQTIRSNNIYWSHLMIKLLNTSLNMAIKKSMVQDPSNASFKDTLKRSLQIISFQMCSSRIPRTIMRIDNDQPVCILS
jgi:ATP-dependent Clp protease ATP-binding subunit ClpA